MRTEKELYEALESLRWVNDPFGVFTRMHIESKYKEILEEELSTLYFEMFPRRRVLKKGWQRDVPEEKEQKIVALLRLRAQREVTLAKRLYRSIDAKLQRLSMTTVLQPAKKVRCVDTVYTSSYHTQGWGMEKYTLEAARDTQRMLEAEGFCVVLEKEYHEKKLFLVRVMADAEPWQVDVCRRRRNIELAVRSLIARGINPRVYYPFLPERYTP